MGEWLLSRQQHCVYVCVSIRTLVIKFMEVLILAHTKKEPTSELPKGTDADLSLDAVRAPACLCCVTAPFPFPQIPPTQLLLDPSELREEAGTAMGALLQLTASPTASRWSLPCPPRL